MVDLPRVQQLQREIGAATVEAAKAYEQPWIEYIWSEVGGDDSYRWFDVVHECGCSLGVEEPNLDALWRELRKLMADAETGAWLSAELTIGRSGDKAYSFNFDKRVFLNGDGPCEAGPDTEGNILPDDGAYVRDLEWFPRAEQHRPEWYPAG